MDLNKSITGLYKQRAAGEIKKRQKVENVDAEVKPIATFQNLHGCYEAIKELQKIVDHFQRNTTGKIDESNWPILICGSKGLGKTSLVEATANYSNLRFVPIKLNSLAGYTRSEFKDNLDHLLKLATSNQPAIVLIDDLNKISEKEDMKFFIQEAIKNLVEPEHNLLVFCTTSSTLEEVPDIDFSSVIYLKRPDLESRFKILVDLKTNFINFSHFSEDVIRSIATNTPSFSAPNLKKMLLLAERASVSKPDKSHCEAAIETVKQSFKRGTHLIGQRPSVTWKDIGGMVEVRQAFIDILRQTRRNGLNCKFAGVALYGPPGCGKTMVAQAMANEAGFNFISIKPAELINKFLGETEKNIRRVFHEAREHEPCMIYFDEFDGLCGTRGNKDNITSAIQTLLAEMDGFVDRGKSIILASTNRLEDIDPAMKRPGRLSKHIFVGPPDENARLDILKVITNRSSIKLHDSVDLQLWSKKTENFTGAELDFLIAEAEALAGRNIEVKQDSTDDHVLEINQENLDAALKKIKTTNRELDKKTKSRPRFRADR